MQYVSTRDASHRVTLGSAICRGLAIDGGLYGPEQLPAVDLRSLREARTLPELAVRLLAPFAAGDALGAVLAEVAADALDFPAPVTETEGVAGSAGLGPLSVLELFHGPTAAFKDFGARFLAAALERLPRGRAERCTILVATSGDTGGAVAAAFHGRPWARVVVLYPSGLVSARQRQQLACWGGNVQTLSVAGTFDDCQALVKGAFADPGLVQRLGLSSANSINVGRLLPQMVYYATASLALAARDGAPPSFVIPTGNLGNALACVWGRELGLPIADIVLATNANRTVVDYVEDGRFEPRPSLATLASAMDVGNPSNLERLRWLDPDRRSLRGRLDACAVGDDEIRETIRRDWRELNRTWCPHTATAASVYRRLPADRRRGRWVIVATAHPAKFDEIVEPLIGTTVPVPDSLAEILARPRIERQIAARPEELHEALLEYR
jgi:threonine synthase